MIFVDSGAWYASLVPGDVNHARATTWLQANSSPLLTSDFVIDETLTLLRKRGYQAAAIAWAEALFAGELAEIVVVSEGDLLAAYRVFKAFDDKAWSFTDCTSRVLMERLGISTAFAFDRHFHQFGSFVIVP